MPLANSTKEVKKLRLLIDTDLKARVYARDAGCCQVCLVAEPPHIGVEFTVKRYDMDEPSETEALDDVALFCERCALIIKKYLALIGHEVYLQNKEEVMQLRLIDRSE